MEESRMLASMYLKEEVDVLQRIEAIAISVAVIVDVEVAWVEPWRAEIVRAVEESSGAAGHLKAEEIYGKVQLLPSSFLEEFSAGVGVVPHLCSARFDCGERWCNGKGLVSEACSRAVGLDRVSLMRWLQAGADTREGPGAPGPPQEIKKIKTSAV
ncbi:hypothetical protein KSP40_PGU010311 [Platanthera guangdongensis]|uniref:Uncharacterized protein n=1 Tax=Platanthera guangdongensis TaxID=2320717 RepID=A0ABR2M2T4_9ASPA